MKDKRLALIIGISNYQFASKLRNPVNDVISMESVLSKLGFHIITLKNPTMKEMKLALNDFGSNLDDYDTGLFYFAGHGIQVKGINYLIPMDANPLNENQVEFDCLNANLILSLMSNSRNETNILILDACRNNPFERSWNRSLSIEGLTYMSAPYGTLIAYSTSPDKTASDGEGNNGLYTSILIDEILTPNLTVLQVMQNVRMKLIKESEGQQVPWESTSLLHDYVLNDDRCFSISTFCKSVLYNYDRDFVLNALKLDLFELNQLSKLNIPISEADKNAGIIEVFYQKDFSFFDTFKELQVNYYQDGEREYNLFTYTRDTKEVQKVFNDICKTLGYGIHDDEKRSSFFEPQNVKRVIKNKPKSNEDECFNMWYFDHVTFFLRFLYSPKRQFLFTIKVKPLRKVIDRTINDLFLNDFHTLISIGEEHYPTGEYEGKYIDYYIKPNQSELDFFNQIVLRVFDRNDEIIDSNVFLTNSNPNESNISTLNNLVFKLTSIYGVDCNGNGYLSGIEEDEINNGDYWSGRNWILNLQHQIQDSESNGEQMLYQINLYYEKDEGGIELSILGYNSMLKYTCLS